ncbi:hypothetical protein GCM10027294_49580 [Marinactinospora endophytica]
MDTFLTTVPPGKGRALRPDRTTGPAVEALIAAVAEGRADLPGFWRTVEERGTPLVERIDATDQCAVTFLWRGGNELADVILFADKAADADSYECNRMERIPGTDVWHLTYRMRADWRSSYAIAPVPADPSAASPGPLEEMAAIRRRRSLARAEPADRPAIARWFDAMAHAVPDPRARERLDASWSVVSLPDAPPELWRDAGAGAPGTVEEHSFTSAILGNTRTVWIHEPARRPADGGPWPVLVLLDGEQWAGIPVFPLLDALIERGDIPPMVSILVSAVDFPTRTRELACHDPFVAFLDEELLPWASEGRRLTSDPEHTIIAGQSLGGLTALYAAHTAAHRFGRAISQSGSFWWPAPVGADGETERLTRLLAQADRLPGRVHLSVGVHEWRLLEPTRRLRDTLAQRGAAFDYVEYNGGHDRACWRAGLPDGIVALTGGGARSRTVPAGDGAARTRHA